ncbi:MAG TPA: cupin domain-containing protein [Steroidobacteraceae bacterium]|nr:cupin domain-containing protein [Steroidobacteraceae bacterium]
MPNYFVGSVDEIRFQPLRDHGATGSRRMPLVGHATAPSCVHTGLDLDEIAPGGHLAPVMHAYEKAFYVLEGDVIFDLEGRSYRLEKGHYGLMHKATPYAFRNPGDRAARLLTVSAPQPKPQGSAFQDTYSPATGLGRAEAVVPNLSDPRIRYLGKFEESSMPSSGAISGVGVRSKSIYGVAIKEFVDRLFGAQFLAMFMVQFIPGGFGTSHDHPHEETYFFLSGKAEGVFDGDLHLIRAGQYVWTGVGCFHSFRTLGEEPVRWIETQAPLPADYEAFRFRREWEPLAR